jgi:ApaG protein
MASKTTQGIKIAVKASYLAERSVPAMNQYLFTYRIKITNEGETPAQLMHRQWLISDALGRTEEVRGPGVIGKQPRLRPGDSFEYESFCPLPTPFGSMRGIFRMIRDDGDVFDAEVPLFSLVEKAPKTPSNPDLNRGKI